MTFRQTLVAGFFVAGFCSGVVAADKPNYKAKASSFK